LTFEGGYRLYPNIKGHLWKIEAKEGNNTWDLDIDEFTGKPASAKISGFWGAIGFIVSI
jgi:hypothetical protein